jgi:hypothetical protein
MIRNTSGSLKLLYAATGNQYDSANYITHKLFAKEMMVHLTITTTLITIINLKIDV